MIELIPWMLILVWSHPDRSDDIDIQREHQLFASADECRMQGANKVAGVEMYHLEHGGAKVTFACVPVPSSAEYEALYAKIYDAKRQEDREMPKKPDPSTGDGQ